MNPDIYIEIFGAVTGLLYVYLEIGQRRVMWVLGGVSALAYIFIFLNVGLYAAMALQLYYLCASFYGWQKWKRRDNGEGASMWTAEDSITVKMPVSTGVVSVAITVAGALFLWRGLYMVGSDPMPALDAVIAALSMMATYWVANKFIESWFIWIVANVLAVCMYLSQGLYPTAILYAVYIAASVAGYLHWRKFRRVLQ